MPSYALTNLGPYQKYSYDPYIDLGTVIAAQDRPIGGNYDTHAAIWSGNWELLPDPPSGAVWSVAVYGTASRVVGFVVPEGEDTNSRGALWEKILGTWQLTVLPMPTNGISSNANAISSSGTMIVGQVNGADAVNRAAVWRKVGGNWTVEELPQVHVRAYANGIDEATEDVIGNMLDVPVWHAVRWHNDGANWLASTLDLPGAIPPPPHEVNTEVYQTNGSIKSGAFALLGGPNRAATWDNIDAISDLNVGDNSFATAEAGGTVVGVQYSAGGEPQGFVWDSTNGAQSIHPSGQDWSWPSSIDAAGRIVGVMGTGSHGNYAGSRAIFMLTES